MILLNTPKITLILKKDHTYLYFLVVQNYNCCRLDLYKLVDNYRINDYLEYRILYILYNLIINKTKFVSVVLPFNSNIYITKFSFENDGSIHIVDKLAGNPTLNISQENYDHIISSIAGYIYV